MSPAALEPSRGMETRVAEFHDVVSGLVNDGYTVGHIGFRDGGVQALLTSPVGLPLEVSQWIAW